MIRDGKTREVIEQVAFIDVGPDGISKIDLMCSGFLPEEELLPAGIGEECPIDSADGYAQ